MTAVEMKYKFDIKMRDLLRALNHPFTTSEINRFLNEAQLDICKKYIKGFELDENSRQILSVLVKPFSCVVFSTDSSNHINGRYAEISGNILAIVSELVNDSIKVKPVTHDEYSTSIVNPFKVPYSNLVWRMDRNDLRELITDGVVQITKYSGDYIEYPQNINIDTGVNCILPSQIHEDIIDSAVLIAFNIINRTSQILNPQPDKQQKNLLQ